MNSTYQALVSVPTVSAAFQSARTGQNGGRDEFFSSDPPGRKLGSGGGTGHLLLEAWRATGEDASLPDWLRSSRKVMIHGGGESRRLPAYAAIGKPLTPVPTVRWAWAERLDQTLLDLELRTCERVLASTPPSLVAMVGSGDTLLDFGADLPPLPEVDVLSLGMEVEPEVARNFGVFFMRRDAPDRLAFFLQKPTPETIRRFAQDHLFLVDTGVWLFSEKAIETLLRKSGWDGSPQGDVDHYELYSDFGLSLGETPTKSDAEVEGLTSAVVNLPDAEFLHLGTSRQLIESVWALQNKKTKRARLGARDHPSQITQNARVDTAIRRDVNHTLWIENAHVADSWTLAHDHVLTGVPENDWAITLEPGVCVDFAPVGKEDWCVRVYGFDDAFSGPAGDDDTLYLGRSLNDWLKARGVDATDAGIDSDCDIQRAPLFPVLPLADIDAPLITWLFATEPTVDTSITERWLTANRLSATAITEQVNLDRWARQQNENRLESLGRIYEHRASSVFYQLDLAATADMMADGGVDAPPSPSGGQSPLEMIHDHMWRSRLSERDAPEQASEHEAAAFGCLRQAILGRSSQETPEPVCQTHPDQIVWARSPARMDLAGGWTDTPPYCILHGGTVTNIAVEINGQPPIQVYAKLSKRPEIVIRSIDFGIEQRITEYEQLDDYATPGSGFALAKAAFVLTGFGGKAVAAGATTRWTSLAEQLKAFGGGIELTLLCALPAGSGLGASSILGATILGALNDLCGLSWDRIQLAAHVSALEQMMTTGGGWQDQVGGLFPGLKVIETRPGLDQTPTLRWLPSGLLDDSSPLLPLLYYTGITRTAKNILQEIVKGMFLNEARSLAILRDIGANAWAFAEAAQKRDFASLRRSLAETWRLKQALDGQTNPPAVDAIIRQMGDGVSACSLLGAGGGGYLLMFANDADAAIDIKRRLVERPPNPRARFVEMKESSHGLEVTRS